MFIILLMILTINITFPVDKNLIYKSLCKRMGIDMQYLQGSLIVRFLWLSYDSSLENSLSLWVSRKIVSTTI